MRLESIVVYLSTMPGQNREKQQRGEHIGEEWWGSHASDSSAALHRPQVVLVECREEPGAVLPPFKRNDLQDSHPVYPANPCLVPGLAANQF